jgi:hypothetical protein
MEVHRSTLQSMPERDAVNLRQASVTRCSTKPHSRSGIRRFLLRSGNDQLLYYGVSGNYFPDLGSRRGYGWF